MGKKGPGGGGWKGEIWMVKTAICLNGKQSLNGRAKRVMEVQTVAIQQTWKGCEARRGEARRLHERQRGRGGKWGGGRGAYNSEWQAEKERQRREWELGKVAGEIREWQDEGLNDGGEGGQEGDGLKSRDTELWGYMSKREGREAGEMSEWFDVLQ